MAKRGADGNTVEDESSPAPAHAGGLGSDVTAETELVAGSVPRDMILLNYDSIVSSDTHIPTHIASTGAAVFQSEGEAVFANVNTGDLYHRCDVESVDIHGIAEDDSGRAAFCVSKGDVFMAINAAVDFAAIFAISMPECLCGGSIAVVGQTVVAVNEAAVGVVFPFEEPTVHMWAPPARVAHFIKCRRGAPIIALMDHTTWRPCWTDAGFQMGSVDLLLWNPLFARDVDCESGLCVTVNNTKTCTVLVSRVFPHFSDVHIPITPVRAAWENNTVYILGDADDVAHSPAIYAVTPAIGAVTATFFPDKIRLHPSDSLAQLNDLRGRFVLYAGALYLLCVPSGTE